MDSVFQMFRLIFALLISIFVFIMLFHYGSQYISFGELNNLVNTYNKLKQNINDVSETGNSLLFKDISSLKNNDCIYSFEQTSGLYIKCEKGSTFILPLISVIDFSKTINLERRIENISFTNYYYVIGFPLKTYFISIDGNIDENILHIISILPSESNYIVCGTGECTTSKEQCNKEKLIETLNYNTPEFSECNININNKNTILLKLTYSSCTPENYNLCFSLNSNLYPATITLNDGRNQYTYIIKNDMDFLTLLNTLNNKEQTQNYLNTFDYFTIFNKKLLWDLKRITKLSLTRAELISKDSKDSCHLLWDNYITELNNLDNFINSHLYENDYNNINYATDYILTISKVNNAYKNLVDNGCDYDYEYQTSF